MRKFSAVLMCILLFGSLLAACGGKNNTTATKDEGNKGTNTTNTSATNEPAKEEDIADKKITLKINYPKPDEETLRTTEDDKIKRFQAKYPNVTSLRMTGSTRLMKLGIKMASNEAPTFFTTWATEANLLILAVG